jgi:hypothetical protein
MRTKSFFIVTRLIMAVTFLLAGSCAMLTMKGYKGPDLSADRTAAVERGVYLYIDECDGMKLGAFQNRITVLPGDHTLEMSFQTQTISDLVLYSRETASLRFKAEAGHTYVAYAHWVQTGGWTAYVMDKKTGERVAQSETLPIVWEHIIIRPAW